jgi:hypothetical protein
MKTKHVRYSVVASFLFFRVQSKIFVMSFVCIQERL